MILFLAGDWGYTYCRAKRVWFLVLLPTPFLGKIAKIEKSGVSKNLATQIGVLIGGVGQASIRGKSPPAQPNRPLPTCKPQ